MRSSLLGHFQQNRLIELIIKKVHFGAMFGTFCLIWAKQKRPEKPQEPMWSNGKNNVKILQRTLYIAFHYYFKT